MKYLKLFENFLYRKINPGDLVTILHDNYSKLLPEEDFSDTISKIRRRYIKWEFEEDSSFISDGATDGLIYRYARQGKMREYLCIRFLGDEWFLVEIVNGVDILAYECDQLDGLYDLLDNLTFPLSNNKMFRNSTKKN